MPAKNQETDPVQAFAAELRRVREEACSPSFRSMAHKVHFSSSALAEAVQGRRLPSKPIVEAFARACGADPSALVRRWSEVAGALGSPADNEPPQPILNRWPSRITRAGALIAAAIGGFGVHWAIADVPSPTGQAAAVSPLAIPGPPHDGADPADGGCSDDSTDLAASTLSDAGQAVGVLQLRYSAVCQGIWSRYTMSAQQPPALVELRLEASDGRLAAYAQEAPRGLPLYTDLLRPQGACLRALVLVHLGGRILTGTTPCLTVEPHPRLGAR